MNNQEIQNLIKELLEKTDIKLNDIIIDENILNNNSNMIWFSLNLEEPHLFVSRDGEALHAFNYLVKKIVEKKLGFDDFNINKEQKNSFLIDINDFHKKRVENLKNIVHMMAERARYFKSNIEIDPMNAFDRRMVHEFLSSAQDLQTESRGIGKDRRVVIKYIGTI